jgi:hypothetical protein
MELANEQEIGTLTKYPGMDIIWPLGPECVESLQQIPQEVKPDMYQL